MSDKSISGKEMANYFRLVAAILETSDKMFIAKIQLTIESPSVAERTEP